MNQKFNPSGFGGGMPSGGGEQLSPIKIDPNDLESVECMVCGNTTFYDVFELKKISPLQDPMGNGGVLKLQAGIVCFRCQAPLGSKDEDYEDKNEEVNEEETIIKP